MKLFLSSLLCLFSLYATAAPKAEVWSYWDTSDEKNESTISHQLWQQILDNYLIQKGEHALFDYASVTQPDKKTLNTYLNQMTKIDVRQYNKKQQYAYWVNLYNALTINLVLKHYPVTSIKKIGGLFSFGPWDDKIITLNQHALTLNDIEHRILRPIWKEPRTHYVLNCASLGCPNLQQQALTANNSERLLEEASFTFINSDKGVQIQESTRRLSSIYQWFADDFGSKSALWDHLIHYRPALKNSNGKIRYDYDWDLNDNH